MLTGPPRTPMPRGHTLWEVLLVLAILGVVCGLAAPAVRLARSPAADLPQARREILALIEQARLIALQRSTSVDIRIDPSTGHAWVFALEGDTLRVIATSTLTHLSAVEMLAGAEPRLRYTIAPDGRTFGRTVVLRGPNGIERISADPWMGGTDVSR